MNYIMLEVKLFNVQGNVDEVRNRMLTALAEEFGDDHEHADMGVEVMESA
jgi:hypothetical protein